MVNEDTTRKEDDDWYRPIAAPGKVGAKRMLGSIGVDGQGVDVAAKKR